jgi:hypothetical protein
MIAIAAASMVVLLTCAGSAMAYDASGVSVVSYATGFRFSNGVGPTGLVFDQTNRLFAVDYSDARLYGFSAPGAASPATRVGSGTVGAHPAGLAIDPTGRMYLARKDAGDVLEIDRNTGVGVRTVANGLTCPTGLALDPVTGDLFVTEACHGSPVIRIAAPASATPTAGFFGGHVFAEADGITVGADGTIYVVDTGTIVRMAGANDPAAGQTSVLAQVPKADGIALGQGTSAAPPYLLVNRNDGVITRVDLTSGAPHSIDVLTGGTRGDFVTLDASGCVYATQTTEILKITNSDGTCGGNRGITAVGATAPTTSAEQVAHVLGLPSTRDCIDRRKFTFKLHHAKKQPVVDVVAFINGKRKAHKRGGDIKRLVIKRLPRRKFVLRIVATQKSGSELISTRTYKGCLKSRPKTRGRHHH